MTTDYVSQQPLGLPGINRDQTPFQTKNYVDGQWTRFYNNEPRKMGGYLLCNLGTTEIVRGLYGAITGDQIVSESGVNAIHLYSGRKSGVSFFLLNNNGISLATNNVTAAGYVPSDENMWNFDQYSERDTPLDIINYIIAMVSPNLFDIGSNHDGAVYYGICGGTAPLIPLGTNLYLNGFVLVANPFVFLGGQKGILMYNDLNKSITDPDFIPSDNFLFVSNTRLVAGKEIRGGNTVSILVWSLTSLYRLTYTGNPDNPFARETISANISIISQNCVVEVPEISTFFWIGKNCFYQYNGVTSELINHFNKLWFFNNINTNAEEKCWATVNSAYNEVEFHFAFGDDEECTRMVIYNYIWKVWYDSRKARVAGISANFLSHPIQVDSEPSNSFISPTGNTYGYWMHEYGTDLEINSVKYAIKSYIRTHDRILASMSPNQDLQTRTRRLEPDMFLDGQMKLQIYTKQFPGSEYEISREYFLRDPVTGLVGKTDIVNMGRIVSYYFESNEVGGFFQFGRNIIDLVPDGSERPSR